MSGENIEELYIDDSVVWGWDPLKKILDRHGIKDASDFLVSLKWELYEQYQFFHDRLTALLDSLKFL